MTRTSPRPSVTLFLTALLFGAPQLARADGDPATNDVLQVVPYQGRLEKDGQPVSGEVKMYFRLYDGAGDTEVWHEAQLAQVFAGRFVVLLGICYDYQPGDLRCPDGAGGPDPISTVIGNADDLQLAIDLEVGGASVTMMHRKRFLPVPYAMLSTNHPVMVVDQDLTVGGDATVTGAISAGGDLSVAGVTTMTGGLTVDSATAVNTTVTGALNVTGTVHMSCPSDMTRFGTWCIDNARRPVQTWTSALTTCHNDGRDICPYSALMACDQLGLSGSNCVAATDDNSVVLWTSDRHTERDDFNESWVDNVICYKGDNEIDECSTGESHDFFCCIPGLRH